MASEITLRTKDGEWKAEVEAWKTNLLFYRSIGTEVTVFHREQKKNIWGNTVTDWVRKAANSIRIVNVYTDDSGPARATREKNCTNSSHCELKEWSAGFTITLPADSIDDVGGGAILDLDKVEGSVEVVIGNERLTGEVSASSALSDSGIW